MDPVLGAALSWVRYYETDEDLPVDYAEHSPSGQDVGMGVELGFDNDMTLSVFWVNPRDIDGIGYAGHLVVADRSMGSALPDVEQVPYEVGDWAEWRPMLGRRIERVDHVWHPKLPWRLAVRLHLQHDSAVTVALGSTSAPGDVTFAIDNLAVFHDQAIAATYLDRLTSMYGGFLGLVIPAAELRDRSGGEPP